MGVRALHKNRRHISVSLTPLLPNWDERLTKLQALPAQYSLRIGNYGAAIRGACALQLCRSRDEEHFGSFGDSGI
jgi:hypothetical protein